MLIPLLLLALAQDADLQALDDPDFAVREKAAENLSRRGVEIVPRIVELHRETRSPEVRSRTETLLLGFPFEALALTRPDEPLHAALRKDLLEDLEEHRSVPGCWQEEERRPLLEGAKLRILVQGGNGHGQHLQIDHIVPGGDGGLNVRRIAYQGTTPYRPAVKEEFVRVEETRFDADEARTLAELLQAGAALQSRCAIPEKKGHSWSSSGSFSMRFRIECGGTLAWSAAYTGYPGSAGRRDYAHGQILDEVIGAALEHRSWREAKLVPEDRARALQWMRDHFASEEWWVKEHYLDMARLIGDESYLPFLRQVAQDLEGKEDSSELRESALQALTRIESAGK